MEILYLSRCCLGHLEAKSLVL
ncbi:hypothetical protein HG430_002250 [Candidatus Gracilibacteria bacterium]|nr:hypothetical protein [Candidatus Gracilibacteria bacterium]MBF0913618.1 hypothetical protein [Candidatus Gracilibacteria bacterium]